MIVLCEQNHKLWSIEMTNAVFESFKKTSPDMMVKLEELTPSMYKTYIEVPIGTLTSFDDYETNKVLRKN